MAAIHLNSLQQGFAVLADLSMDAQSTEAAINLSSDKSPFRGAIIAHRNMQPVKPR